MFYADEDYYNNVDKCRMILPENNVIKIQRTIFWFLTLSDLPGHSIGLTIPLPKVLDIPCYKCSVSIITPFCLPCLLLL